MASGESGIEFEGSRTNFPWGRVPATPRQNNTSLNEIMSEQLAEGLQTEEAEKYYKTICDNDEFQIPKGMDLEDLMTQTGDCSSDEVIANMLQLQFNREYDADLKKIEQKYNGASKGNQKCLLVLFQLMGTV